MIKVVELKDESTAAHTWRVALYCQALAESVGMSRDDIHRLMHAAVLHDIGKIDIPYAILSKPSALDHDEFEIIKTHTILGYDRLRRMGIKDEAILALVRSHHERLDGSGYPDGLQGDAIHLWARYFAVIDTFDAMTSIRPYRRETGLEAAARAIAELRSKAGLWYCPQSVALFTELIESGQLDWIGEHFNDQQSIDTLLSGPRPEAIEQERVRILDDLDPTSTSAGEVGDRDSATGNSPAGRRSDPARDSGPPHQLKHTAG